MQICGTWCFQSMNNLYSGNIPKIKTKYDWTSNMLRKLTKKKSHWYWKGGDYILTYDEHALGATCLTKLSGTFLKKCAL